ncbi:MAG TPA: SDR family NAD(P)-dependent oxidoreductase [Candidatus Baltobacteraceae bacterium]|nr:SDR family NAD(P)-dependent oxidoreductase [Candidatus Baltobacteraceae bacterium]
MTRLAGKSALITGGGTGIGQAMALAFAREGAQVAVAGRRKNKLEETLRLIEDTGCSALALECDVTKAADTIRAVESAEDAFGKLNILVNNAGALSVSTVETIAEDDWDHVMATNIKGPFLMSRAALPAMRRAGGGSIINVGSVLGIVAIRDRAAYCASKGAVSMLTRAMALDHAHDQIRVNCLCPSIVESDMTRNLFAETEAGRQARESRLASIPLGRFGKPDDVAGLAVFLASDESSWMTGTVIPVDGGVTAY